MSVAQQPHLLTYISIDEVNASNALLTLSMQHRLLIWQLLLPLAYGLHVTDAMRERTTLLLHSCMQVQQNNALCRLLRTRWLT